MLDDLRLVAAERVVAEDALQGLESGGTGGLLGQIGVRHAADSRAAGRPGEPAPPGSARESPSHRPFPRAAEGPVAQGEQQDDW
ncbi:hypothetical protein GCM10009565_74500 [Amycolatopsis albidoflavus]